MMDSKVMGANQSFTFPNRRFSVIAKRGFHMLIPALMTIAECHEAFVVSKYADRVFDFVDGECTRTDKFLVRHARQFTTSAKKMARQSGNWQWHAGPWSATEIIGGPKCCNAKAVPSYRLIGALKKPAGRDAQPGGPI